MKIWIDAQLSPSIAEWITSTFDVEAHAVRTLGLRDAEDYEIFRAAREENAVVLTKDRDFVDLLDRFGPPPKVIWLTCGNTSNPRLQEILNEHLREALAFLEHENLVEIG